MLGAALAAGSAALGLLWLSRPSPVDSGVRVAPPAAAPETEATSDAAEVALVQGLRDGGTGPAQREAVGRPSTDQDASPEGQEHALRARILDRSGEPCAQLPGAIKTSPPHIPLHPLRTDQEGYLLAEGYPVDALRSRPGTRLSLRLVDPLTCWVAELAPSSAIVLGAEEAPTVVADAHPRIASGEVRLGDGSAAARANVWVEQLSAEGHWTLSRRPVVGALSRGSPPRAGVLTDAAGAFALYGEIDPLATRIGFSFPGTVTRYEPLDAPGPSSQRLVVELAAGAALRGRLRVDPRLPPGRLSLELLDCRHSASRYRFTLDERDPGGACGFSARPILTPEPACLVVRLRNVELARFGPFALAAGDVTDVGLLEVPPDLRVWHVYPVSNGAAALGVVAHAQSDPEVHVWSYGSELADGGILVCTLRSGPVQLSLTGVAEPQTLTLSGRGEDLMVPVELPRQDELLRR